MSRLEKSERSLQGIIAEKDAELQSFSQKLEAGNVETQSKMKVCLIPRSPTVSFPGHPTSASFPGHPTVSFPGHPTSASFPGHPTSASFPYHTTPVSFPGHPTSTSLSCHLTHPRSPHLCLIPRTSHLYLTLMSSQVTPPLSHSQTAT